MSFQQLLLASAAGFIPGSTLDMIFFQNMYRGATPAQLTYSRADTFYAETTGGVWVPFSANTPRITNRGILIEEARTNSIRNNSMQGAVAGTPGTLPTNWGWSTPAGLTRQIVGTGVQNGIEYLDIRVFGTASSATSLNVNFEGFGTGGGVASNGQVWTLSAFHSIVTNPGVNLPTPFQVVIDEFNGGTFVTGAAFTVDTPPVGSMLRGVYTRTLSGAGITHITPQWRISFANGVAYDITIRIGWPQLELGAFATSPIRTTTVAVTRAQDAVSLAGANFTSWFTAGPGTIYSEYEWIGASTAGRTISISDGTTANVHEFFGGGAGSNVVSGQTAAATVQRFAATAGGFNLTMGQRNKTAHAFNVADYANIANGNLGALTSGTAAGALPTGLNVAHLGNRADLARSVNGYLRRIAYIPSRLSNAELQALTV